MDALKHWVVQSAINVARFHSVAGFLQMLAGPNAQLDSETGTTQTRLTAFYAKWSSWRIGFSHFMQLTHEPTESCL